MKSFSYPEEITPEHWKAMQDLIASYEELSYDTNTREAHLKIGRMTSFSMICDRYGIHPTRCRILITEGASKEEVEALDRWAYGENVTDEDLDRLLGKS